MHDTTERTLQIPRPLLHFTPRRNWMNDPNGLLFHNGVYHLFFQYNPAGIGHANMSWGHATSSDLVNWHEHPVAIAHDDDEQIYSGSAVFDETNSSGFGSVENPPLVAIYTSARADGTQSQALAFSLDDGDTWTKHAGNPVLDRRSPNFRDPKVFRYRGDTGEYWVMVAVEAHDRQVVLYRSDDLKEWLPLSTYGPAGAVGGVWECPDLFPLALDGDPDEIRWVLLVSLYPGGLAGGSGTQYVVGNFDGVRFTPERMPARVGKDARELDRLDWLDAGRDCYAGVTFNGLPDDERVLIAWMSNWDYAGDWPGPLWRGAMTVPRRLALVTVDGRAQLRAEPILARAGDAANVVTVSSRGTADLPLLPAAARIDLEMDAGDPSSPGSVALVISGESGEFTIRLDGQARMVELDRKTASEGMPEAFASTESVRIPKDADLSLTVIVDHSSVELFIAGGVRSITDQVLMAGARSMSVATSGGARVTRLQVTDLSRASEESTPTDAP